MTRFWLSFWSAVLTDFEYHGPWWISGERGHHDDGTVQRSICAAVVADSEEGAQEVIRRSFDVPRDPEWRFVEPQPDDWEPFCDRFERAAWMRWPWPSGDVAT